MSNTITFTHRSEYTGQLLGLSAARPKASFEYNYHVIAEVVNGKANILSVQEQTIISIPGESPWKLSCIDMQWSPTAAGLWRIFQSKALETHSLTQAAPSGLPNTQNITAPLRMAEAA